MSPVVYHGAYGQEATVYRYAKYHPPFTPVQLLETTDYNDIDFASFKHCQPDQTSVLVNGQWWYRNAGSYLPGLIPQCVDDAMLAQLMSYDPEAIFNSHWVYMCDGETPQLTPCVEPPAPRRPSPCDTLPCPNPYCDCPALVEPPIIVEPPYVPPTDVNPPYTPGPLPPSGEWRVAGGDWLLPALLVGGALLFFGGSGSRKRSNGLSHGFGRAAKHRFHKPLRHAITLDQFQDRTALLPHIVADVVSGGDRAFADSAADRTVHLYNHNEMFRREMNGSRGRDNLYKWMRHWWASWEYRKSLNEKFGPGTVPLGRARSNPWVAHTVQHEYSPTSTEAKYATREAAEKAGAGMRKKWPFYETKAIKKGDVIKRRYRLLYRKKRGE